MKKISIIAAVVMAAIMASCGNGTPKANLKDDVDSLAYAAGMANSQGIKDYLVNRLGVDTTYIDEFIKGLNDGAAASDNKKKSAYYAGIQVGMDVKNQLVKGINYEIFGEDSTQTINVNNLLAAFVCGATGEKGLMTPDEAFQYLQNNMQAIKDKQSKVRYAEWKEKNEQYMDSIAKTGKQALANGIYYEVITAGDGEIPADSSMVKVQYEGKTIDGKIFDTCLDSEPRSFYCKQVIPGWTEALTHMPVGSTWKVYIPQDQAYGARNAGDDIKPYSTLVFTVSLLSIEE